MLRQALSELERAERSDELPVAIPPMVPTVAGAEAQEEDPLRWREVRGPGAPVAGASWLASVRATSASSKRPWRM